MFFFRASTFITTFCILAFFFPSFSPCQQNSPDPIDPTNRSWNDPPQCGELVVILRLEGVTPEFIKPIYEIFISTTLRTANSKDDSFVTSEKSPLLIEIFKYYMGNNKPELALQITKKDIFTR